MVSLSCFRIKRQTELLFPVECKSSFRKGVITILGAFAFACDVSGVGGNLVCNHALLDVFLVWQTQVLFGGHVAQHGGTVHAGIGRTDAAGDMVVTRSDVGDQWAQNVERSTVADFDLPLDVHLDLVQRNVSWSFNHDLRAFFPTAFGAFTENVQFGELSVVGSVCDRPRTQSIAERPGHVVLTHDVAKIVEGFQQWVLLVVSHHPFGDQRSTAADDTGHAIDGQVQVFQFDTAVNRHVVNALLGLVLDHVQEVLSVHVFDISAELFQHLVDRHGSDWNGALVDDLTADVVNVFAGRQIHDRVGTEVDRGVELFKFFANVAGHGAVADVRVDFALGSDADRHRFQSTSRVDFVGWDHHAARGDFIANQLDRQVFAFGDVFHFGGDFARAGRQQLGHAIRTQEFGVRMGW